MLSHPFPIEPALHSYLGQLESVPSQNDEIEDFKSPNHLFPRETVPLKLPRRYAKEISSSSNNLIGIVNMSFLKKRLSEHGTVCEVRARSAASSSGGSPLYNADGDADDANDVMAVAVGKYRFRVISTRTCSGLLLATVELFYYEGRTGGSPARDLNGSFRSNSFPPWIYEHLCPHRLARKAWELFSTYNNTGSGGGALGGWADTCSSDPLGFSYYVAANIPLGDADRLSLLECPSVVTRLKCAITLMSEGIGNQLLCCSGCLQPLARRSSVFKVDGAFGIVGNYINAHGVVHQTVTVKEVLSEGTLVRTGQYSTEDCWFPGHKWQIISCSSCYKHLGWHYIPDVSAVRHAFRRMARGSSAADDFFGFRRDCLSETAVVGESSCDDGGDDDDDISVDDDDDNGDDDISVDDDDDNGDDNDDIADVDVDN